ncbi:MAG: hypothetical protein M3P42_08685 [Actinomycetota bacterium]|nr:hypothetical protein [Actinomycetota bacterium]
MTGFLTPQVTVDEANRDTSRYVRSYLVMRVLVGALAVALPPLLVFGDGIGFDADPFPRGSLSSYFFSGTREIFVGTLSATAVFLLTYKVAERNLDNTLSWLAGIAVLSVAMFPTNPPSNADLTPLQERLGENLVATIHYISAATFIGSLGVISFFFGVREGKRRQRTSKLSPKFWRRYHWFCAGTIAAAIVGIVIAELIGWPPKALLIGEWVAVWAFGASWLMKGFELDILRGRSAPAPTAT